MKIKCPFINDQITGTYTSLKPININSNAEILDCYLKQTIDTDNVELKSILNTKFLSILTLTLLNIATSIILGHKSET